MDGGGAPRRMQALLARVAPEWVDYNGHMNVGYYNVAFDRATDAVFDYLDMGVAYVERTGKSLFVVETHVRYLNEVVLDDPLRYEAQLLGFDSKRVHLMFWMYQQAEEFLSATSEQMCLHVDLATRRTAAMPTDLRGRVAALAEIHAALPWPPEAGRSIARPRG